MQSTTPTAPPIPAWEHETLDLFVGLFESFGLPRSMALIYGTLYCAEAPMQQEEISHRLCISAGSASQGLKLLQSLGAVRRQIPVGSRLSLYTAELSMRRLLGTFLETQFRPKLRGGGERLDAIAEAIPEENEHARNRIQTLQSWHRKMDRSLPLLTTFIGSPKPDKD